VQFKRTRDRVTAGNGADDHDDDDDVPEPDRLRAIAESTIARVEQLEKPTAKDLSAAQQAQRVLGRNRGKPLESGGADPHPPGGPPTSLTLALSACRRGPFAVASRA
jgi:hypothetical protein